MADDPKSKSFPDISAKLSAPAKRSFFERQKAEAEAKRVRESAETAAVYEDFVKSFEDDSRRDSATRYGGADWRAGNRPLGGGGGGGGGPPRRHFTNSSGAGPRKAGPGTLGPSPQSFPKKRAPYDGNRGFRDQGVHGFDAAAPAFHESDDEDDKAVDAKEAQRAAAKPTLYLATLPPGTSPAAIKSLIPSALTVDNVKILPQSRAQQNSTERRSLSAIVTLANESAASDIDSTVSALQNKYLGWGYNLSISRHLSSAAIGSTTPVTVGLSSISSQPFGAKQVPQNFGRNLRHAPPPGSHRRAFAPPGPYGPAYGRGGPLLQVEVQAPSDLKQLKLIHKTLENLLNYGPEFEALLMSRPEVQRDEKWAWLWDPRSPGGVYYRWKLWDIITNSRPKIERTRSGRKLRDHSFLFEGGAGWLAPDANNKFEYTTQLDEFVSDDDYDSSDEELSDREDDRRIHSGAPPKDATGASEGIGYMNPLQKAKLTHLLARLPTTIGRLRKGDIARVTAFALEHAGAGADEVVDMIISNIINPVAYTGANPENASAKREGSEDANPNNDNDNTTQLPRTTTNETQDRSPAKLVSLYVVSDILSSSATSGVRHAWRYRQLFESALKARSIFQHLGRLEKDLKWGRLRAEKWKRSVGSLLNLWDGWCVFPQSSQEHFVEAFENPPLTEKELQEEKEKTEAERAAAAIAKGKSRWKAVEDEAGAGKFDPNRPSEANKSKTNTDRFAATAVGSDTGESMSDIDGVPMEDSDLEDPDGEPFDDGSPMEDIDEQHQGPEKEPEKPSQGLTRTEKPLPARKPRPKAEDMFADSESE